MTKIGPTHYDQATSHRHGVANKQKDGAGDSFHSASPAQAFKVEDLQAVDFSGLKGTRISELPSDQYEAYIESQRTYLEAKYMKMPEPMSTAGHASFSTYATVGSVSVNNAGHVVIHDDVLAAKINREIYDAGLIPTGLEGPALAEEVAKQIAQLTGATVSGASTALTQSEYAALPALKQENGKIDREAMRSDPFYALLDKISTERSEYLSNAG